jgi:hypothetical protein
MIYDAPWPLTSHVEEGEAIGVVSPALNFNVTAFVATTMPGE